MIQSLEYITVIVDQSETMHLEYKLVVVHRAARGSVLGGSVWFPIRSARGGLALSPSANRP